MNEDKIICIPCGTYDQFCEHGRARRAAAKPDLSFVTLDQILDELASRTDAAVVSFAYRNNNGSLTFDQRASGETILIDSLTLRLMGFVVQKGHEE